MKLSRIGNWYEIVIKGKKYNVFIQKDEDKVTCSPDTSIVFNEEMTELINDSKIIKKVEKIMEKVDWKYDLIITNK